MARCATVWLMRINGSAVRALRIREGLTITALASKSKIERSVLNRIETGTRKGTPAQAKSLAEFLNVPMSAIVDFELDTEAVA